MLYFIKLSSGKSLPKKALIVGVLMIRAGSIESELSCATHAQLCLFFSGLQDGSFV